MPKSVYWSYLLVAIATGAKPYERILMCVLVDDLDQETFVSVAT